MFDSFLAGKACHPIRATLLNITYDMRIHNYRDVGYFPIMYKDPQLSDAVNRLVKLAVYSKCLSFLLKDMKTHSFTGKQGPLHTRLYHPFSNIS